MKARANRISILTVSAFLLFHSNFLVWIPHHSTEKLISRSQFPSCQIQWLFLWFHGIWSLCGSYHRWTSLLSGNTLFLEFFFHLNCCYFWMPLAGPASPLDFCLSWWLLCPPRCLHLASGSHLSFLLLWSRFKIGGGCIQSEESRPCASSLVVREAGQVSGASVVRGGFCLVRFLMYNKEV